MAAAVKVSRSNSQSTRRKTVKKMLFTLGVAVLFLNTLVVTTAVRFDGGATGTNCGGGSQLCKP